jgi:ABC-type dipeptide/oligopeptide/nickel transport system permease subunit
MSRNTLFVISLVVVSALSAGVAYGMFAVGRMDNFEMSKMYFAAAVLAFLAFIFLLAMIFYAVGPEATSSTAESPGKGIFDACVKVIPPLVTLIIGFYFGATSDKAPTTKAATSPASASSTAKK